MTELVPCMTEFNSDKVIHSLALDDEVGALCDMIL